MICIGTTLPSSAGPRAPSVPGGVVKAPHPSAAEVSPDLAGAGPAVFAAIRTGGP